MNIKDLLSFLDNNPKSIFILLTVLFGYGYYTQTSEIQTMNRELGELTAEVRFLRDAFGECVENSD